MVRFLTTVLLLASVASAQEKTIEERLDALEKRAAGTPPEVATKTAGGGVPIEVFFRDGLHFRTEGGEFEGRIGANFMFHARFFIRHGERVSSDTFQVKQARILIEGKIFKDWEFRVEPKSSSGGSFVLDDGYVGFVHWHWLKLRAGQFKAPFGLEQLQSDAYTDFPERSVVVRFVPSREIGFMVHGEPIEKVLSYQLMVANGTGRTDDNNSDKDVIARIWTRPAATSDSFFIKGIHVGVAATYGKQNRGPGVLPYTYSDPMTQTVFATAAPTAPSVKFDQQRFRGAVELAWLVGRFKFQAEGFYTRERYTITGAFRTHESTRHTGGYALASLFLTDDVQTWDRVRPKAPLFGDDGGFGAVSVAVRGAWFRISRQMFEDGILDVEASARQIDEYTFGVNWYPNQNVRISVAYTKMVYHGKHANPVLVNGKLIDTEDVLVFRAQVDF